MRADFPPDAFDRVTYADLEHTRRRFSRLASIMAGRIEWADDKLGPIPYSLGCVCMHTYTGIARLHDKHCPLAALDE